MFIWNDTGSIHMDIITEDKDHEKVTFRLRSLTYRLTTSQIRYWDFEAGMGVFVGRIVKVIKSRVLKLSVLRRRL